MATTTPARLRPDALRDPLVHPAPLVAQRSALHFFVVVGVVVVVVVVVVVGCCC